MTNDPAKQVDSFRFVPLITKKLMQGWYPKEPPAPIPWTALAKPLVGCRVALISSAGLVTAEDEPFDRQGERDRPWWGDPGFRRISRHTRNLLSHHLHINTRHLEQDLNCVFPIDRLSELESGRVIGAVAKTHYSFMGYLPDATEFLDTSVPRIIEGLQDERVDIVLLVPV